MSVPIRLLPPEQNLVVQGYTSSGPFSRWLQKILLELHRALCPPKTIIPCYLSSDDVSNYFDATGLGVRGSPYQWWAICNGNNGTPNLEGLYLKGSITDAGTTGGATKTNSPTGAVNVTAGGVPAASSAHFHVFDPPHCEVVFLMRVSELT